MNSRPLIIVGVAWFIAVAIWLRFGTSGFSYAWPIGGLSKRVTVTGLVYLLIFLYQIFIFGWVIPLAIGTYKLVKKH